MFGFENWSKLGSSVEDIARINSEEVVLSQPQPLAEVWPVVAQAIIGFRSVNNEDVADQKVKANLWKARHEARACHWIRKGRASNINLPLHHVTKLAFNRNSGSACGNNPGRSLTVPQIHEDKTPRLIMRRRCLTQRSKHPHIFALFSDARCSIPSGSGSKKWRMPVATSSSGHEDGCLIQINWWTLVAISCTFRCFAVWGSSYLSCQALRFVHDGWGLGTFRLRHSGHADFDRSLAATESIWNQAPCLVRSSEIESYHHQFHRDIIDISDFRQEIATASGMGSESDMINTDIVLNEKKIKKTHPGMRSCVLMSWHPSITTTKKKTEPDCSESHLAPLHR